MPENTVTPDIKEKVRRNVTVILIIFFMAISFLKYNDFTDFIDILVQLLVLYRQKTKYQYFHLHFNTKIVKKQL